jgi:integrase
LKIELPRDPDTGKRRYHREVGFKNDREAHDRLVEVTAKIIEGTHVESKKSMKLAKYAEEWLATVRPNLSPRTYQGYERNLRLHVLPYCGQKELSRIELRMLNHLYLLLLRQGLSSRSVLNVHRTIHRMLHNTAQWEYVGRNAAALAQVPKQERKEMEVLDKSQTLVLLRSVGDSLLGVYVALALTRGLRRGEIAGLKWKDVDFEADVIHITQTVQRIDGKGLLILPTKTHRSRRAVELPDAAGQVLKKWRRRQLEQR